MRCPRRRARKKYSTSPGEVRSVPVQVWFGLRPGEQRDRKKLSSHCHGCVPVTSLLNRSTCRIAAFVFLLLASVLIPPMLLAAQTSQRECRESCLAIDAGGHRHPAAREAGYGASGTGWTHRDREWAHLYSSDGRFPLTGFRYENRQRKPGRSSSPHLRKPRRLPTLTCTGSSLSSWLPPRVD